MTPNTQLSSFEQQLSSAKLTREQTALMSLWYKQLPMTLQTDLLNLLAQDTSALSMLTTFLERKQKALRLQDQVAWKKIIQDEIDWLTKMV
ncbi:MAG: hypothetical protein ACD_43C00233G0002 [uncultured bacterium]|nr:MAG: hypothetical protein ACD_43C00233G0002 [uncultured bacterium]